MGRLRRAREGRALGLRTPGCVAGCGAARCGRGAPRGRGHAASSGAAGGLLPERRPARPPSPPPPPPAGAYNVTGNTFLCGNSELAPGAAMRLVQNSGDPSGPAASGYPRVLAFERNVVSAAAGSKCAWQGGVVVVNAAPDASLNYFDRLKPGSPALELQRVSGSQGYPAASAVKFTVDARLNAWGASNASRDAAGVGALVKRGDYPNVRVEVAPWIAAFSWAPSDKSGFFPADNYTQGWRGRGREADACLT